ncbi:DUF6053 domain-containing protein [Lysobacter enzymogenes]|uniref:DUF6053 domain-containing protein n=1 Tax=Lysobacter enzymogenes TaxID=69 RepID=UPI003D18D60E
MPAAQCGRDFRSDARCPDVGRTSVPTLSARFAAICAESVGTEVPPTTPART